MKFIRALCILVFANFFISNHLYGQISHGGKPNTLANEYLKFAQAANTVRFNSIDNNREKKLADSIGDHNGIAPNRFYGKGIDVDIDIKEKTSPVILSNGNKLWLYNVKSENAYAMQFYFDKFRLPAGATLYFYNEEKDMVLGAFTNDNNNIDLNFGTQFIKGQSIFIEYTEPADPEFSGELHIDKAIHVFRDLFKSGQWGTSGACNIDVSCSLGYDWRKEIASVALILSYDKYRNLASWCSGVLLNNTSNDGKGYFLTAKHCGDTTRVPEHPRQRFDYSTWVFIFNYEDTMCNDAKSVRYPVTSVYGAGLLAADGNGSLTSDYLLLKLNASKDELASLGVAYAGWEINESNALSSPNAVCIHHPSGDVEKISKDNHPPVSAYYGNGPYFWQLTWDSGTTEPVSSGSPLFNSNHRVIGQLYAGEASCDNPTGNDYFGKLAFSWTNGNFAQWLDPANSSTTYVDTYQPNSKPKLVRNNQFLINPNPSLGIFYIIKVNRVINDPISIKIYNSVGQLIKQVTQTVLVNNEIDLSNERKGLYMIQIETSEGIDVEKVLIL
jgi:hypothetical protein